MSDAKLRETLVRWRRAAGGALCGASVGGVVFGHPPVAGVDPATALALIGALIGAWVARGWEVDRGG